MSVVIRQRQFQASPESFSQDLHPVLRNIFARRSVTHPDQLSRTFKHLLPYQQLSGLDKALALLHSALQEQWKVLVVGDFDADGATSTAVTIKAMRLFGLKNINFLVPNRFEYGYGLSPEIVKVACNDKPDLIITVDNGISSIEGVSFAKEQGIKVLVTDHHLAGKKLPDADAIVNPNVPGDDFPSKNLAGVGVVFYVMLALNSYLQEKNYFLFSKAEKPNLTTLLDLVALGTVADVVPLDHNNRILVHQGLLRIRQGKCSLGIKSLLKVSKRDRTKASAQDIGFAIGPRLNAAGRLEDMSIGIRCLLSEELEEADNLALQLNQLNEERKSIESDMKVQAESSLKEFIDGESSQDLKHKGICVYDAEWHQGVIGILASRLKEQFTRPVIAFAPGDGGELKGSARSIPGLHIRDLLDTIASKYPGLLSKFGGHAMAAGMSLPEDKFSDFESAFYEAVDEQVTESMLEKEVLTDGDLSLDDFSIEVAGLIRNNGPWGQAFPEPLFEGVFQLVRQKIVGQNHLKMTVVPMNNDGELGQHIDAIAFNIDTNQWPNEVCQWVRLAYRLDINEFLGAEKLQLIVEHLELHQLDF